MDVLSDPQKFFENQMIYGFFNNAFLSDNILWSSFVDQGDLRVLIMDLKNKNQIIAKYNSWYPVIQCSSNGYFYAAINVDKVLEEKTITNTKRITQYPISYDSNPIILRFKPKQIFK